MPANGRRDLIRHLKINARCCSFLVPDVSTVVVVGVNFRDLAFRQQTFSRGMGELSRNGSPSKI